MGRVSGGWPPVGHVSVDVDVVFWLVTQQKWTNQTRRLTKKPNDHISPKTTKKQARKRKAKEHNILEAH